MLDESICILGVLSLFCRLYSIFDVKKSCKQTVDPNQMPHDVASDLGLHCLSMTLFVFPSKNGLKRSH